MALWDKINSRGRVEDRRALGPVAVGGIGLGGLALYLIFNLLTGGEIDANDVLGQLEKVQVGEQQNYSREEFEGEDDYEVFAATVLGSNNDMWREVFAKNNQVYEEPRLVLFREATNSGCGNASSQVGPHYCPVDKTIYLDETFFDELQRRFGARGGDVAEAYVLAHEVAHHAQNELGIMSKAMEISQAGSDEANDLSVKLELQADCFAGLWAYSIRDLGIFMPGEINEAIDAAAAVGDDRIQERVAGYINPETWTHGSSAQRVEWFNRGYGTGTVSECNTFEAK